MNKEDFTKALDEIPIMKNNCVSTYDSIDVNELLITINRLNEIPNYETLLKENNNLNKGIDELINEYQTILNSLNKYQTQRFNHTQQIKIDLIKEFIEKLKNLKGE